MQKPRLARSAQEHLSSRTESSDQSRLNRPLSTWSEAEDAIHTMAKVAPEHGYDKTGFRVEWADGEVYEVRLDIARVVVEVPRPLAATSAAPWNSPPAGGAPPT